MTPNEDFIEQITPDVLKILERGGFFEMLDARLCAEDTSYHGENCQHTFESSRAILLEKKFSAKDIDEILQVLKARGACCDCEVLYNVSESNRLKSKYWKSRVSKP